MPEKKQTSKNLSIVHSITCGAIVAHVHFHRSNGGFGYHSFTLQRVHVASTGKQASGTGFFAKNTLEITMAATQAAEWINAQQQANS
jgi:hypothetical protein